MNGSITSKTPIITRTTHWCTGSVRAACIRNDLYTLGTNDDYSEMLKKVDDTPLPTEHDIWEVGMDIVEHSECQDIENVMYILANEAVKYCFCVEYLEDI